MSMATDGAGNTIASWGDSRNPWVSPADAYYPGVHPQSDVLLEAVRSKKSTTTNN